MESFSDVSRRVLCTDGEKSDTKTSLGVCDSRSFPRSYTSNTASTVSSWSSLSVMWVEISLSTWMDCSLTSSISSLNMSTRKSRHFSAKLGDDRASWHNASTAAIRTSETKFKTPENIQQKEKNESSTETGDRKQHLLQSFNSLYLQTLSFILSTATPHHFFGARRDHI